jgi:hypothetical protein
MDCETCEALLSDYKNLTSLLKNAVRNTRNALGDDYMVATKEADRLHMECCEAREALSKHWRGQHVDLAPKVPPL